MHQKVAENIYLTQPQPATRFKRECPLTPVFASILPGERYNDLTDPRVIEGGCGNAALDALPIEVEALP